MHMVLKFHKAVRTFKFPRGHGVSTGWRRRGRNDATAWVVIVVPLCADMQEQGSRHGSEIIPPFLDLIPPDVMETRVDI